MDQLEAPHAAGIADMAGLEIGAIRRTLQEHQDGIAREHAVELDDAVRVQIGIRIQLDEGVGAVAEPVNLARRRTPRRRGR